jgi:hypothetical protein
MFLGCKDGIPVEFHLRCILPVLVQILVLKFTLEKTKCTTSRIYGMTLDTLHILDLEHTIQHHKGDGEVANSMFSPQQENSETIMIMCL